MSFRTSLKAAVLALALPALAWATVVVEMSFEELARKAPLVVRGTVGSVQASWDEGQRRIWTYAEVKVAEPLKGRAAPTLLVKQPGGVVGPVGQAVAGTARFSPGEETVLFLEPAVDEPGAYVVLGLAAGKVDLEKRLGQRLAVRRLFGLSFAKPGERTVRPVNEVERLGTAEAFLERVRRAAKGGAR